MNKTIKILFGLVVLLVSAYLLIPDPQFPPPPPGSLRSDMPGDMESSFRRAYFTNYSRSEILAYYGNVFSKSSLSFFIFPQLLMNYPPEDAFTQVRDQTMSSWLQEYVHIGRESIFINGFYPTKPTEQININGVHYLNKITLRYLPSSISTRLTVLLMICICFYFVKKEYEKI